MNWEAIGAVGEIVGAAAVVFTLAYLAAQIRHNSKLANADAHERAVKYWSDANQPLMDPGFAELFQNGCESYKTLNPIDQMRFDTLIANMIFSFEIAMEKNKHGFATDDMVASFERYFEKLVDRPGVREYLNENRDYYTSVFHEWLDKVEKLPELNH